MSEKERRSSGKARRRGILRGLLEQEAANPQGIEYFLEELRGRDDEADTQLIDFAESNDHALQDDFAHSQLGILTFEQGGENQLRYQLRWLNRGYERTDFGPAEICGNDLLLLELPECIQPLHLISGQGLYEDNITLNCEALIDITGSATVRRADTREKPRRESHEFAVSASSDDEEEGLFLNLGATSRKQATKRKAASEEIDEFTVTWEQDALSIRFQTTRAHLKNGQSVLVEWKCGELFSSQPELRDTLNVVNPRGKGEGHLKFIETVDKGNLKFQVYQIILCNRITRPRIEEVHRDTGRSLIDVATNNVAYSLPSVSLSLRTSSDIIGNPSSLMHNVEIYIGPYLDGTIRFRNGILLSKIHNEQFRDLDDLVNRLNDGNHVMRFRTRQKEEQLRKNFASNSHIESALNDQDIQDFVLRCDPPFYKENNSPDPLQAGHEQVRPFNRIRYFLEDFLLSGIRYAASSNHEILEENNPNRDALVKTLLDNLLAIAKDSDVKKRFQGKSVQAVASECRAMVDVIRKYPKKHAQRLRQGDIRYLFASVNHYRSDERQKDSQGALWYTRQQRLIDLRKKEGERYINEQRMLRGSSTPGVICFANQLHASVQLSEGELFAELHREPTLRTNHLAVDHLIWFYLPRILSVSNQLFDQSDRKTYALEDYFHIGVGQLLQQTKKFCTHALPRNFPWRQFAEKNSVSIHKLFQLPESVLSIQGFQTKEERSDLDIFDESWKESVDLTEYLKLDPSHKAKSLDAFVAAILEHTFKKEEVYGWARRQEIPPDVSHDLLKCVREANCTHRGKSRCEIATEIHAKFEVGPVDGDTVERFEQKVDNRWRLWLVKERVKDRLHQLLRPEEIARLDERILGNKRQTSTKADLDTRINCIAAILELGYERTIDLQAVDFLESWLLLEEGDDRLAHLLKEDVDAVEGQKRLHGGRVLGKLLTTNIAQNAPPLRNRHKGKGQHAFQALREADVAIEFLINNPCKQPQTFLPEHSAIVAALRGMNTLVPKNIVDYHIDRLSGNTPTATFMTPSITP